MHAVVRSLLGVLLVLVLTAGAFLILPLTETADRNPIIGSETWMSALDDALPLNRIWLPGSHDSATQYAQLAYFTRCQSLSVREQLEAGIRYLDIRLGTDDGSEDFSLKHGFLSCKTGLFGSVLYLDRLLQDCYGFLEDHPSETIVFVVKYEHGNKTAGEVGQMLDAVIQKNEDAWLLADAIPTLGEARGRLVLFRRYEDEASLGARAGIPMLWEEQRGKSDTSLAAAEEKNGSYTLLVQDRFEYNTADKWKAFLSGMEETAGENDVSLNFLSTKGTAAYGHPYTFAEKLNRRLLDEDLSAVSGCRWIVVDYVSPALAEHIYSMNTAQA